MDSLTLMNVFAMSAIGFGAYSIIITPRNVSKKYKDKNLFRNELERKVTGHKISRLLLTGGVKRTHKYNTRHSFCLLYHVETEDGNPQNSLIDGISCCVMTYYTLFCLNDLLPPS